ncbi:MAG TPA: tetratricopeptide repeat protein, partial [Nocardioidaceae bacterium]|nr:tetratricopeptide repeat protein [Nocardioidaceae bacterium]
AALARDLRAKLLRAWNEEGKPLFVEFDNIRSALTWTLDNDAAADRTFDFLAVLWYHALQFHAEEIAGLADRALEKWPDTTHARWSEVAGTAAAACATIEDYAAARRLGTAAANATGSSQVGVAFGHCALADVAGHADDDPGAALAHLDRADEAAAGAGFEPLRCDILGRRAVWLAQSGRSDEALATAERALDMARAQNNAFEYAWSQHLVGLLLATSQPAAAHEWVTKALAESRELLYPYGTNSSLRGLAVVSAVQGDLAGSAALFSESLTGFTRAGHLGERWNTLAALLSLLVAAGRRESAATLLVGLDASGVVVSRIHAPQLDDIRDRLATELDSPRVTTRGRAMSPDQLLALARNELRQLRRLETVRQSQGANTVERQVGTVDEPTAEASAVEGTAAELCRVGDLWRVTFAGTTVHLPDLRGVRDLAVLLGRPGTEVPALDLATPAGSGDGTDRPAPAAASAGGEGLGTPGDLGERLDARARAEYAARIRELQSELDEADADGDAERGARARQELDFLTQELSAAYGMRGPRRAGDPAEKARSAVTARIRAAMAKIREVHPELGRHLDHSIHTGRFCSYRPDPPITWDVIV